MQAAQNTHFLHTHPYKYPNVGIRKPASRARTHQIKTQPSLVITESGNLSQAVLAILALANISQARVESWGGRSQYAEDTPFYLFLVHPEQRGQVPSRAGRNWGMDARTRNTLQIKPPR